MDFGKQVNRNHEVGIVIRNPIFSLNLYEWVSVTIGLYQYIQGHSYFQLCNHSAWLMPLLVSSTVLSHIINIIVLAVPKKILGVKGVIIIN